MKGFVLTLICCSFSLQAFAVNPLWIKDDKRIITTITALLQEKTKTPKDIEEYFLEKYKTVNKENLGFGWQLWKGSIGGGYISISASFYYYNKKLTSYVIYPSLPTENILKASYLKWYSAAFPVSQQKVNPYYFNESVLKIPLLMSKLDLDTSQVAAAVYDYMSPLSGIEYGYSGGYGNSLLKNMENFIFIKEDLTSKEMILVMHSINPASRLTAIEYYTSHKSKFKDHESIEKWIEVVYNELPEVESLVGCIGGKYNARNLVAKYCQIK